MMFSFITKFVFFPIILFYEFDSVLKIGNLNLTCK